MHRMLVLADDLTGALEVGAKFATTGAGVKVTTNLRFPLNQVQEEAGLVIDTETRHMLPEHAGQAVFELGRAASEAGFRYVYKKTDSTLRGNIAAEFKGLCDAFPDSPLLFVPAYPKMGRTVRAGILCVNGIPVTDTSFARDGLNPVGESYIPRLLSAKCTQPIISTTAGNLAMRPSAGIYVCDGETDADLEVAARRFVQSASFRLAASPAGFADHLAPLLDLPRTTPPSLPMLRRVLVVNGSRNEVSIGQIQHASRQGWAMRSVDELANMNGEPGWMILDQPVGNCNPVDFARQLSMTVKSILSREEFEAIVAFGGDTAYAILDAFGITDVLPIGEVQEGVPISTMPRTPAWLKGNGPFCLISKAGGFGPVDVLCQIKAKLTRG
jgi:D-threonate/D-erythronate kinase